MNNYVRSLLFLVPLSICAESVGAAVVYTENFESGTVGTEWTTNSGSLIVDTAPGGQKILGADDGLAEGLSNQSVTLALTGLAAHSTATVSFDFIAIDSLDDTEPFTVVVDGATVFGPVTFINRIGGPTESSDVTLTGAPVSLDTHAFPPVNSLSRSDAVYRISFVVPHTASTMNIAFAMSGLQSIDDESWSLDNIQIDTDAGGTNGSGSGQPTAIPTTRWFGLLMMSVLLVVTTVLARKTAFK